MNTEAECLPFSLFNESLKCHFVKKAQFLIVHSYILFFFFDIVNDALHINSEPNKYMFFQ